jgi:hypothetical protein
MENSCLCAIYKSSVSTGFAKQIMLILLILCYNGSVVTWTVVNLTTAKFKPLIFSLSADLGSSLWSLGSYPTENTVSIVIVQQYFDCCLHIRCRGNLFTESLPSIERLLWLRYSGFQASHHNSKINSVRKCFWLKVWSNRKPNSIHTTPFDLQFLKNDMREGIEAIYAYNCKEGWKLSVCEEIWSEDLMVEAAAEGGRDDREGWWGAIATAAWSGLGLMWRGREWV